MATKWLHIRHHVRSYPICVGFMLWQPSLRQAARSAGYPDSIDHSYIFIVKAIVRPLRGRAKATDKPAYPFALKRGGLRRAFKSVNQSAQLCRQLFG